MSTWNLISTTVVSTPVQFFDFSSLPWNTYNELALYVAADHEFDSRDPTLHFLDLPDGIIANKNSFTINANQGVSDPWDGSGNNSINDEAPLKSGQMARYTSWLFHFYIPNDTTKFGAQLEIKMFGEQDNLSYGGWSRYVASLDKYPGVPGDLRFYPSTIASTGVEWRAGTRFTWYGVN